MIRTNFRGGEGGGFNYPDTYKMIVDLLPDNANIVEVGVWDGESTICMAELIRDSGKRVKFYAVDSFKPFMIDGVKHQADYEIYFFNTEHVRNYIHTIICDSQMCAKFFDRSLDFVFIDADHEYLSVKADIAAWLPKIKAGGILAGHDYDMEGVKKAVDEVFDNIEQFKNTVWLKRL